MRCGSCCSRRTFKLPILPLGTSSKRSAPARPRNAAGIGGGGACADIASGFSDNRRRKRPPAGDGTSEARRRSLTAAARLAIDRRRPACVMGVSRDGGDATAVHTNRCPEPVVMTVEVVVPALFVFGLDADRDAAAAMFVAKLERRESILLGIEICSTWQRSMRAKYMFADGLLRLSSDAADEPPATLQFAQNSEFVLAVIGGAAKLVAMPSAPLLASLPPMTGAEPNSFISVWWLISRWLVL